MIRNTTVKKNIINLDGPDGNAISLMARVSRLCRDVGLGREADTILNEMRSGDYTNLVKTFDKYFGEYVVLETDNEDLL
tara:strand:- start:225 stop:461 length:237 start_codon:yes stop_codon:yes gene_type:complete